MKKWLAIALVVLALAVAAPYGVGVVTEQQWQSATRQLNAETPFMQVQTNQYDRHYLSGHVRAKVRVVLPETGETHRVAFSGDISHGVTGSELRFTPSTPDDKVMKTLFPDKQPSLTITTHLWGTMDVDLEVPAITIDEKKKGEHIKIAALSASAAISKQGNAITLDLDWPGARVEAGDTQLALSNMTLTQDIERVAGRIWQGSVKFGVGSMQVNARGKPALQLKSLRINSDTDADDNRLSSKTIAKIESVSVEDEATGPHQIALDIDNVSIPAWNKLMNVAEQVRTAAATTPPDATKNQMMQRQMQAMKRLGQAARNVAAAGLSVGMPVIEMEMPEGVITGDWALSHPEVPKGKRSDMPLLLQQAEGRLSLTVPRAVARNNPAVANGLQGLIQQGFVTRNDKNYRLKATLKDMMVNVNGKKIPVPPLI